MENPLLRMKGLRDTGADKVGVPSSIAARSGADHTYFYAALCGAFGLAASIWLSSNIQAFAYTLDLHFALLAGISAACLALIVIFQSILVASRLWNFVLIVVESLGLLSLFIAAMSAWFFLAMVVFFIWLGRAYHIEKTGLEEATQIRFLRYANGLNGAFFTALTIFCALVVAGLYNQFGGISPGAYAMLFRGVERPLTYTLGVDVTGDRKVESIINDYTLKELSRQTEFGAGSDAQREAVVRQAVRQGMEKIDEQLSVSVMKDETMAQYTYRLFMKGIAHIKALHLGPLVGFALLFFGALFVRSFLIFIKIPVLLLAQFVYWLLMILGVLSIATEDRPKEVIVVR